MAEPVARRRGHPRVASVDVQQILAAGHRLDRRYLDEWVEALQVEDRWAEAQHDAG